MPTPSPHTDAAIQIRWVQGPSASRSAPPTTAEEAVALLERGSAAFSRVGAESIEFHVDREAFGIAHDDTDGILTQRPFAAVLSCSDARVPIELTLGRAANDLFVVRVAGNVPGSDCRGSLHYAAEHLPSVQLFTVIGHSQCGAVTAAVDAMLEPHRYLQIASDAPLRGIIDSLLAGVHFADRALTHVHGTQVRDSPHYRTRMITLATLANTALTAAVLRRDLSRPTAFGVYKLATRNVGVRRAEGWVPTLEMAPQDDSELTAIVENAARSLTV
ncbi:carbonic anhydrase [Rhodococcus tukisamuensis]|uniref:Carbonic anhydrase n=1 Tax=Rhodococcus tukisamuensis TaxID=168276 RepID=A0A1G6YNB8_9NOCA|nr:carbonic anhydrase [Rhodococcus tukisamuensis]SDD91145.1 carbonic anhydrase [Rhodococcus tukisamuensis]